MLQVGWKLYGRKPRKELGARVLLVKSWGACQSNPLVVSIDLKLNIPDETITTSIVQPDL